MRISEGSSDVWSSDRGGMKTADVCRKHGISSATLYAWKAKYGGMDVSQARKLKRSEEHTSELQSLMRISYAVFCLKKKRIYVITPPSNERKVKSRLLNTNERGDHQNNVHTHTRI